MMYVALSHAHTTRHGGSMSSCSRISWRDRKTRDSSSSTRYPLTAAREARKYHMLLMKGRSARW